MLSHISHEMKKANSRHKEKISKIMDLIFIVSVPYMFGIIAISDELVLCYYGRQFYDCAIILRFLSPVTILFSWSNIMRMQYIIPSNMDKLYIVSTTAGAIVNLLSNIFLIPMYSSVGAAVGTVLANITIVIIFWISLRKDLPLLKYLKNNIWVFTIGLIMFLIIKIFQLFHSMNLFGLIIDVIIGFVSFASLIIIVGFKNNNHLVFLIINKYFGINKEKEDE